MEPIEILEAEKTLISSLIRIKNAINKKENITQNDIKNVESILVFLKSYFEIKEE